MACGPCKIILDGGGVLPGSANLLADTLGHDNPLYAPARYLAAVVAGSASALRYAIEHDVLTPAQIDQAHAFSELNCHRAAVIRGWAERGAPSDAGTKLRLWAEQDRIFTTQIIGGEYEGAWEVDGVTGIRQKE